MSTIGSEPSVQEDVERPVGVGLEVVGAARWAASVEVTARG